LWLVAIILIFPFLETIPFGGLLLTLIITLFLLSALYSVSDRPIQVAVGFLLAIPPLLCSWAFDLPFFLDTWGTSFAVIISGFWVGALAGALYNTMMGVISWDLSSLVFISSRHPYCRTHLVLLEEGLGRCAVSLASGACQCLHRYPERLPGDGCQCSL